ncbi:MAG: AEC family transporter [Ignavibacteriales bacterium]|nr:MAG: AEC family transporter [Ignavibacteriales bacterium]
MSNFLLLGICFVLGIVFRRFRLLPEQTPSILNGFIIYISLPALTLLYIHNLNLNWQIIVPVSMAWITFNLAFRIFRWLGKRLNWTRETTACIILVCGLGNTSFVGLPMIEVFFGKEGIPIGLMIDQLGSFLVLSTFGIVIASFYSGIKTSGKYLIKRILTFPPFLSLMIALMLLPVDYPPVMITVLEKLGNILAPIALLSVGYQLRFTKFYDHKLDIIAGLSFKLILSPLFLFFLYSLFVQKDLSFQITIFEAAMPPMITAAIVASEYNLNKELASMLVGIGIIISFLTLTGWWYILS